MQPIPALIVSGYLGAGKTTLVAHLLAQAQQEGVRLAIISNEFGDTGIDRALLDAGEEGFVELDGGCVCCRLSDALGETLEQLLTQVQPDRLVLECSGVALPGEILVQFWRPPVSDLVSEEVVVVVVDAERAAAPEAFEETFLEQLEAADLVLLNKIDLVDAEALARAEARVTEITQGQPVLHADHGRVDPHLLFPPDPAGARAARRDRDATVGAHSHERFVTTELSFDDGVDRATVLARISAKQAVRAKGFVRTDAGVHVVQGVGKRITMTLADRPISDALVGRVVIIERLDGQDPHEH